MITAAAPVCFSCSLPRPRAKTRLTERTGVERSGAASVEPAHEAADFLFRPQEQRTRHRPSAILLQTKTPVARAQAGCSLRARRATNAPAPTLAATNPKSIVPLSRPTKPDTLAAANAYESR